MQAIRLEHLAKAVEDNQRNQQQDRRAQAIVELVVFLFQQLPLGIGEHGKRPAEDAP
ncbi:hypothetical protein D3C86_1976570 [compost metagenome]